MLPLFLLLQSSLAQEAPPELTVTAQTSAGPVRGFQVDYGNDRSQLYYGSASVFLGIPFTKQPLGDLRFKLPQPLCLFEEEVGSTEYKPRCPQNHDYHGFDYIMSEDCLYLNVITPNITDGRKRAVMFYIPGGMYQLGGADIYHYKGAVRNLVSRDVVVVVIQYRLSTLGFFTTYTPEFPANRGIFDVLLALRWTANEIGNFGGDPNRVCPGGIGKRVRDKESDKVRSTIFRVTIFGHSAGAHIADALTYSPLAKGLFQQVIVQSGPATDAFRIPTFFGNQTAPEEDHAKNLCNITSLANVKESIPLLQKCFSGINGTEMIKADNPSITYSMSLDGVIFPLASTAELAKIRPNYVVMLGDTTDEFAFSMNEEVVRNNITTVGESTLEKYLIKNVGKLSEGQLARMKQSILSFYTPNRTLAADDHLGWTKLVSRVFTDHNYFAPARRAMQWYKNNNNSNNVFLYDYDYFNSFCINSYQIDDWKPSIHCSELCFLWFYSYEWEKAAAENRIHQSDLEVADNLGQAWTNFAKYGNPGWAPMRDQFQFVIIGDMVSDMRPDWGGPANKLFNEIIPTMLKPELNHFYIDPNMKQQIEKQAPIILKAWLAATCPSWKPLNTTTLTVFPLPDATTDSTTKHNSSQPDSNSIYSLFCSVLLVLAALLL